MESPASGGDMESPTMAAATALRDSSATESAAAEALARLLTAREPALTEKLTAGGWLRDRRSAGRGGYYATYTRMDDHTYG
jgi:hypothetical protein